MGIRIISAVRSESEFSLKDPESDQIFLLMRIGSTAASWKKVLEPTIYGGDILDASRFLHQLFTQQDFGIIYKIKEAIKYLIYKFIN